MSKLILSLRVWIFTFACFDRKQGHQFHVPMFPTVRTQNTTGNGISSTVLGIDR